MEKKYWLFKSEPTTFSIDDLAASPDQTSCWEGVRNYQARNFLRDEVQVGDGVLFYHSNAKPPGIAGMCRVVRAGYPDHYAWNRSSDYYVPGSSPENPVWYMVDVKLVTRLREIIPLPVLRETRGLGKMMVIRKGARLSIQPVTPAEWKTVLRLAKGYE